MFFIIHLLVRPPPHFFSPLNYISYLFLIPSPPTNQSTYRQWTIGPIYYSALVMAEALGSSNTTQVFDLLPNNGNIFTPAYSIYVAGNLARILLFNYVSDPTGASDLTVELQLAGTGGTATGPNQVQVKYLQASSVSQKGNFTWANQVIDYYYYYYFRFYSFFPPLLDIR